jgi:ribosome-binding factor A
MHGVFRLAHALRGADVCWVSVFAMNSTDQSGPSVRLLRVGEQVRHVLSDILQRGDVHDDVLASHVVSVTEVRMSPDLRHATVFIKSLLGQDEEAVLKALRTNTAYLQREVAHRIRLKYAAKLKFLADESFDEGSHIDRLLRDPKVARDLEQDEGE